MRKRRKNRWNGWDKIYNQNSIEDKLQTFQEIVYDNVKSNSSSRKIHFLMLRLLRFGLKDYRLKPIMVLYLTPEIQSQITKDRYRFVDQVKRNVKDEYYVLVLPASGNQCKLEVWNRGKKFNKISTEILKKIVDPYENISFSEQANRGIRQALMELGLQ